MKNKIIAFSLFTYLLLSGVVGGAYLIMANGVSIDLLIEAGQPSFYFKAILGGVVMGLTLLLPVVAIIAIWFGIAKLRTVLFGKKNPWKTPVPIDRTVNGSA